MKNEKLQRELGITEDEIKAIKIYQGANIPKIALTRCGDAHKIMNSLMFPGISEELSRIFIEGEYSLNPEALLKPEEILKIQEDLYSAMYKYGKQKKGKEKTVRFGRKSSTSEMKKRGEIVQNLSTTKNFEEVLAFEKNIGDYFEIEIEPGTACIDINEILGKESQFYEEDEILIAPYNKVEINEKELTEKNMKELEENEIDTDIIGKKLVVKVSPLPSNSKIFKRLNRRERKDKEEKLRYLNDENNKRISCNLITKLIEIKKKSLEGELDIIRKDLSEEEIIKGEILNKEQFLKLIDPEDLEIYSKWKEAYQTVLRYNIREKVNEIEKWNKEKQAKKEKKEIYKNIKEDELNNLTEERSDLALKETLKILREKENIRPRKTNEYERGS